MNEKTKLFVVIKHGVYIQNIVGVFDSYDVAKTAALCAKDDEEDNYHSFWVSEFELNQSIDNYIASSRVIFAGNN